MLVRRLSVRREDGAAVEVMRGAGKEVMRLAWREDVGSGGGALKHLGKVARIVEAWVSPQGSTSRRCILVSLWTRSNERRERNHDIRGGREGRGMLSDV